MDTKATENTASAWRAQSRAGFQPAQTGWKPVLLSVRVRFSRSPTFTREPSLPRRRGRNQLQQVGLLLRTDEEIQRPEVAGAIPIGSIPLRDEAHQQRRGLLAARAPDDVTRRHRISIVSHLSQPGVEELVPLLIRADAERF